MFTFLYLIVCLVSWVFCESSWFTWSHLFIAILLDECRALEYQKKEIIRIMSVHDNKMT